MTPDTIAAGVVTSAFAWWGYTYVGYPLALGALAARRVRTLPQPASGDREWPMITICMVAYNAKGTIAAAIERALALDYPADRRQILIASDASSDGTDDIIRSFAHRGVQLVRIERRCGKTSCENVAAEHIRGDIVVNTDVGVVVDPAAIKHLVRAFDDPTVALASGRDVSIAPRGAGAGAAGTGSEKSYVGYEMMLRDLETRLVGIVGASGCLYAVRPDIQRRQLPGGLCRDFSAALIARQRGRRAVSVQAATCFVPRSTDLVGEYARKRRTCTRGLATLFYFKELLNPRRFGTFAWMLASHKLMRWMSPWLLFPVAAALVVLAVDSFVARMALAVLLAALAAATAGFRIPHGTGLVSRACAFASYITASNLAVVSAWIALARRDNPPVWEPTRRSGSVRYRALPTSPGSFVP